MAPKKEIPKEKRGGIIALFNRGTSFRKIAKEMRVSYNGVRTTVVRFQKTNSYSNYYRPGRPKITTAQEDKGIVLISKRNRRLTASEIRAKFANISKISISLPTIKRRLVSAGLKGCVAVRKPLLRPINRKKRYQWALQHREWTVDQWRNVLWTDESKFLIFGSQRRVYVRRTASEKMAPQCLLPTVKHGGGSVMVWGCFSGHGTGDLIKVEGIMKKEQYHQILIRRAIPSGLRIIGRGFTMQQDNDPKHSSRLCRGYLETKEENGVLVNMVWPPQSPDLNPIELLWEELDRRVREVCPSSAGDLWHKLQDAWASLEAAQINKLIERMPRLVNAVLRAKGGFFDEKDV